MNRCRPAKKGTNEHGKILTTSLMLEKGKVPDRYTGEWKAKSHKERVQAAKARV